jgi:hypothetical protein
MLNYVHGMRKFFRRGAATDELILLAVMANIFGWIVFSTNCELAYAR